MQTVAIFKRYITKLTLYMEGLKYLHSDTLAAGISLPFVFHMD